MIFAPTLQESRIRARPNAWDFAAVAPDDAPAWTEGVIRMAIRDSADRSVFTVARHDGRWAVEHGGEYFDHSIDKEEAKAAANKRARAAQDAGRPCQVRVTGEHGFFAPA